MPPTQRVAARFDLIVFEAAPAIAENAIAFSHRAALVSDGARSLGGGPDTTEAEFSEQSTLVHLFEESGAQRVGDIEHGAGHFRV
jgi:hypothetical protein